MDPVSLPHRAALRCWHFLYCRWYDADRAHHPRRARFWGRAADGFCRLVWP